MIVEFHDRVVELVTKAWDDGNAVGLDGWVGPGRGSGEVDPEATRARARVIRQAEEALSLHS